MRLRFRAVVIFVVGFLLVFVCVPLLLTWAALSVTGMRVSARMRLLLTAIVAYLVWQYFQLPPEQTGGGYIMTHPESFPPG